MIWYAACPYTFWFQNTERDLNTRFPLIAGNTKHYNRVYHRHRLRHRFVSTAMLLGLSAPDPSPFTVHYHHPSDPFEHRSHVPFSFLRMADKETSWNDDKYFVERKHQFDSNMMELWKQQISRLRIGMKFPYHKKVYHLPANFQTICIFAVSQMAHCRE